MHPKRYVVFEVKGEIGPSTLKEWLRGSAKELFGVLGLSETRLVLRHFEGSKGVVETTNAGLPFAITALCFAAYSSEELTSLRIINVTGTIKGALSSLTG